MKLPLLPPQTFLRLSARSMKLPKHTRAALPHPRAFVPKSSIAAVRVVWLLAILWYELGTFYWNLAGCRWPDAALLPGDEERSSRTQTSPTHVLLVADPQVRAPYEHQSIWTRWLPHFIRDISLRKRWTFVRRSVRPDVVVFLGDMLENGRYARSDDEYRASFEYFKSIFHLDPNITVYYVPGNHDVGLGPSSRTSATHARKRYTKHFGPLNNKISIANHTLVMLDAPGLVEEDYRRAAVGKTFENWQPLPNGAVDFINKFAGVGSDDPVILFSHIPLFRPDTAPCGPLREKGAIRRGVGPGFQNILMRDTTKYILRYVRPSIVFSGNDHDYCEYTHSVPLISEGPESKIDYVREVTVKAISSAGDIRRPGFQLLSLVPPPSSSSSSPSSAHPQTDDGKTFADMPCFFPDARKIHAGRYLPLLIFTLFVLVVSAATRKRRAPRSQDPDDLLGLEPILEFDDDDDEHDDEKYNLSPAIPNNPLPSPINININTHTPSSPSSRQKTFESSLASSSSSRLISTSTSSLAPTFRAAVANGQLTPGTPDFTIGGGAGSPRSPRMISAAPPSGVTAHPARLRAPSSSPENDGSGSGSSSNYGYSGAGGDDEEEGFQPPSQMARYRSRIGNGSGGDADADNDYFRLTLTRARKKRRWAWSWSFHLGGRRRRISVGVPFLLEHLSRTFFSALRLPPTGLGLGLGLGGRTAAKTGHQRQGRGRGRERRHRQQMSLSRMFLDDLVRAVWMPVLLYCILLYVFS